VIYNYCISFQCVVNFSFIYSLNSVLAVINITLLKNVNHETAQMDSSVCASCAF